MGHEIPKDTSSPTPIALNALAPRNPRLSRRDFLRLGTRLGFAMTAGQTLFLSQAKAMLGFRAGTMSGKPALWPQKAELTASDGAASDNFGTAVSISGNFIVCGAPAHKVGSNSFQGAAYVYYYDGSSWSQQAILTASDGLANDRFGTAVAISGDYIVCGAPARRVGSNSSQGIAYVYHYDGSSWSQQTSLTASDGATADNFGSAVAISGTTIAIGAANRKVGSNSAQGQAYVYSYDGSSWSQQAILAASDGAASDSFGTAVGVSGTNIVVGAPYHLVGGNASQGAAYAYHYDGSSWSQQAILTASDGLANDRFGSSVSISGNAIGVGALLHKVGSNGSQGAVYIYHYNGSSWSQQAQISASDGSAAEYFGRTVSLSGNYIAVGCDGRKVGSNNNQGVAYVFFYNGSSWIQQVALRASDGTGFDYLGKAIGISGTTVVVGAASHKVGSNSSQGAAYVFV